MLCSINIILYRTTHALETQVHNLKDGEATKKVGLYPFPSSFKTMMPKSKPLQDS